MLVRPLLAGLLVAMAGLSGLAAPAHAVPIDGTLSVTLLDEDGDATPGAVTVVDGTASVFASQGTSVYTPEVPPGSYGVIALTPWSLQCAGLDPCDAFDAVLDGGNPDGSIVVVSSQTTQVTVQSELPATLPGPGRVGKPLTVAWSPGMAALVEYLAGLDYAPTITWLRDGKPIAGAEGQQYEPALADVGKKVSARIGYGGALQAEWLTITGGPVAARTTNAVPVGKAATRSFSFLSSSRVPEGRPVRTRVEVTAPGLVVTGRVTVAVDDWRRTVALRNGGTRVVLPDLSVGRHVVKVRYLGTRTFLGSVARARTLTVTAR